MNDLNFEISTYIKTLHETEERRELWNSTTKKMLNHTLSEIAESDKVKLHVQNGESIENYQFVNIGTTHSHSGIHENHFTDGKHTGFKSYGKSSGRCSFVQSYNGKVYVLIIFPNIEGITVEMEPKVIATLEPREFNDKLIKQYVAEFFKMMSGWEGKEEDVEVFTPVGFKQNSVKDE